MSNTIDNRVVQLDLENASFERNARKSINTLDELDEALAFKKGKKGFEEVEAAAQKTNFSSLIKAAETVTDRLSTLGIIGVTALQNITNKAVDAGERLVKSLTVDQITSGWNKYEEINNSTRTLLNTSGKTAEEVEEAISHLTWFSDETSYSLDQMVNSLSSMVSNGGDMTTLVTMLEGVANSISFAGQSTRTLDGVLYNLNQSYSGGFLNALDFNSLQRTYHMFSKELKQAFIDAAMLEGELDSMGRTSKGTVVDINNFGNTLADRWATSAVMERAFNSFAEMTEKAREMIGTLDAEGNEIETASQAYAILSQEYDNIALKAAKSAQEAKTFTEAIDATKDAVSTGWAETFKIIVGDVDQAASLWTNVANTLWEVFASGAQDRNKMLRQALQIGAPNNSDFSNFVTNLEKSGIAFDDFRSKLVKTAEEYGRSVDEMSLSATTFGDLLQSDWITGDILSETIRQYSIGTQTLVKTAEDQMTELRDLLADVNSGKYGYGLREQMRQLTAAGYEGEKLQEWYRIAAHNNLSYFQDIESETEFVDENILKLADDAAKLGDSFADLNEEIETRSGRELALDGLRNILGGLLDRFYLMKDTFREIFPPMTAGKLYAMLQQFEELSKVFVLSDEKATHLKDAFTDLFTLVDRFLGVGRSGLSLLGSAGSLLGRFLSYFMQLSGPSSLLGKANGYLRAFFDSVREGTDPLSYISRELDKAKASLDSIDGTKFDPVVKILRTIWRLLRPIGGMVSSVQTAVTPFLSYLVSGLSVVGGILNEHVLTPGLAFLNELNESDDPVQTLIDGFKRLEKRISELPSKVRAFIKEFSFKDFFKDSDAADSKLQPLLNLLQRLKEKAGEVKENLDFGSVLAFLAVGGIFAGVTSLYNALSSIGKMADTVKSTFANLNKFLTLRTGNAFSNTMKTMATALMILAAAMYIVSKIPKESLWSSVGVITGVTVVLGLLAGAFTILAKKLSKKDLKSIETMQTFLKTLSVCMLILSAAAAIASSAIDGTQSINTLLKQIGGTLLLVAGMAAILMAVTAILSHFKGQVTIASIVLVLVSIALYTLAKALHAFDNVTFNDNLNNIMRLITSVALLVSLMSIASKLGKGNSIFVELALVLVSVAAAAALMVYAIKELKNIEAIPFAPVVAVIVGLTIVLAAVGVAAKYVKPAVKAMAGIAIGVLSLVAGMFLLELLFERIAAIQNSGVMWAATGALWSIAGVMALLLAVLGLASFLSKGGKGVATIALSMVLIAAAFAAFIGLFAILKKLTETAGQEELNAAFRLFELLAIVFGGLMLAAGAAGWLSGGKGVGLIIAVLGGMIVMTALLVVLSKAATSLDLDKGITAIGEIAVILGILIFAISGAARLAGGSVGATFKLIGITLVILSLGATLALLAQLPIPAIWSAVGSLAVVLVVLTGALLAIEKFKVGIGAVLKLSAMLVVLVGVVWLMVKAFEPLSQMNTAVLNSNLVALGIAVGILAAVTVGMGAVFKKFKEVAIGALLFAAMLGVLGLSALAFASAVDMLDGTDMEGVAAGLHALGAEILYAIGAGLGLFVAALGLGAFALAVGLFGLVAEAAVPSLTMFHVAIIGLLNTLSAVGSAWEKSGGSLIGTFANLRGELAESSEATAAAAKNIWGSLQNGTAQGATEAAAEISDAASAIPTETAAAITEHTDEVVDAGDKMVTTTKTSLIDRFKDAMPALKTTVTDFVTGGVTDGIAGIDPSVIMSAVQGQMPDDMMNSILVGMGFDPNAIGGNLTDILNGGFANINYTGMDVTSITGGMEDMVNNAVDGANTAPAATEMMDKFVGDIENAAHNGNTVSRMRNTGAGLTQNANSGAQSVSAYPSGQYFGQGFANGISSYSGVVWNTAWNLAKSAVNAVKQAIEQGSPSKITTESGGFFGKGFVIGIDSMIKQAAKVAYRMGSVSVDQLNAGMASDEVGGIVPVLNMEDVYATLGEFDDTWRPVIKPILDMSDVNPGFRDAAYVSAARAGAYEQDNSPDETGPIAAGATYNFTQNNYSPKALSPIEVYRQTKNQFSLLKGVQVVR